MAAAGRESESFTVSTTIQPRETFLGAYIAGYLLLGTIVDWRKATDGGGIIHLPTLNSVERVYRQQWALVLFQPAARVESVLCGYAVHMSYLEREPWDLGESDLPEWTNN